MDTLYDTTKTEDSENSETGIGLQQQNPDSPTNGEQKPEDSDWRKWKFDNFAGWFYKIHALRSALGIDIYGEEFVGEPLVHLEEELADAMFYVYMAQKQRDAYRNSVTDLKTLPELCYNRAKEKGFHEEPRSFGDEIALIHSEVSEALEEYRRSGDVNDSAIAEEFADIIIRVCDTAGHRGIDLAAAVEAKLNKNKSREYKHGGKHL